MKVEIMRNTMAGCLQSDINKFIKDKNIIDIKYCENGEYCSTLIIYEEKKQQYFNTPKGKYRSLSNYRNW